ncbi:MAG: hypothetical protein E5V60_00205 [Mesorhizobium sp.]|nr:MAG: hypothetical protein E5V60_00205 [Mesorhizobium sp.]
MILQVLQGARFQNGSISASDVSTADEIWRKSRAIILHSELALKDQVSVPPVNLRLEDKTMSTTTVGPCPGPVIQNRGKHPLETVQG